VLVKSFSYERNKKINKNILEFFGEVAQTTIMPIIIDMIVKRKNAHASI
jgi:hypothetical protein